MKMNLKWWKLPKKQPSQKVINRDNFNDLVSRKKYQEQIQEKVQAMKDIDNPDKLWNNVAEILISTTQEIIGFRKNDKIRQEDAEIQILSNRQKKIGKDIESCTSKKLRKEWKKERNKIMNEIKSKLILLNDKKLDKELQEIESKHSDASKYYEAAKILQRRENKKEPKIINENGMIASTQEERCKIITSFFTKLFVKENTEQQKEYKAIAMQEPFTEEEISKVSRKLKNNKSAGPDKIIAEMIKYSPKVIHNLIAQILQLTSSGKEYPVVLRRGNLLPIPKPPKPGVNVNVRPIILLSMLRKILSMCMVNRCWNRLKSNIPIEQAAYQPGRSTTEQVYTVKTLAEKAITSNDYTIFILMLDMSKAFDSLNRSKLMSYLEEVLNESEMYMMNILINDVVINVVCGDKTGEDIITNVGTCQGDCLSAILFILYLAKSIKPLPEYIEKQDNDKVLWSELDWLINKDKHRIELDPKYSDDISFIRSWYPKINQAKRMIPAMLKEHDLIVNESKTEEFEISRDGDNTWKKCKILGSLLDTECDINRRHGIASSSYKKYEKVFKSKSVSLTTKFRVFNVYVESIFLYNSELWTMTGKFCNKVDCIQRKYLRRILNINWPKKISNTSLYEKTKQEQWSCKIKRRALNWIGHLLRLDPETPARKALKEFVKPCKKPPGRPKETWLSYIRQTIAKSDADMSFKNNETMIKELEDLCVDRKRWRKIVRDMKL